VGAILQDGLKVQGGKDHAPNGAVFGKGIYVSPDLGLSVRFCMGDALVHVVFELRVRLGAWEEHEANGSRYWVVKNESDVLITALLARC